MSTLYTPRVGVNAHRNASVDQPRQGNLLSRTHRSGENTRGKHRDRLTSAQFQAYGDMNIDSDLPLARRVGRLEPSPSGHFLEKGPISGPRRR